MQWAPEWVAIAQAAGLESLCIAIQVHKEVAMKRWLRRIPGAILMGLAWAVVWAPVAVVIGTMIVDPDNSMDEMWAVAGIYPGFLCGAVFFAALGIAERRRRFVELPLSRVGAWGAVSGLLVGGLWLVVALLSDPPQWLLYGVVVGSLTLMSAVSGVGTALLARITKKPELHDANAHVA
jgi:hypothetical protein